MWSLLVIILSSSYALDPDLLTPIKQFGEACGYDACPIPLSTDGINVHIVPHTHYELAAQRTFGEHYTGKDRITAPTKINMKVTLDSIITELWTTPHRRFALSDIAYFFHWWSQRDTTVRQMVYSLIRQGRLVFIGGGWSMNDEATTNYQAIIDSFTYSLRKINATFYKCGMPLVAWQADVMGHSREFASLAAQMGFDALFINPISFDDELARMRRWALEMLWRGSDDLGPRSDIYTHKLFDGYWSPPGFCFSSMCEDPLIITSTTILTNVEQRAKDFMDIIYNRQAPNYNTSHVMVMMGQIYGYFDAPMWFANIDALIRIVNERGVRGKQKMYLMYSTPACFAKAVYDSKIPLETKQDDFYPFAYDKNSYLTGLYTSSPSIKQMAKEATIYLQMCKQMKVFAEIGNWHDKLFEEFNWIAGAFQDHTIITGALTDYVKSYYSHKMYVAMQRSTVLLREAWNKLRKSPTETIYYRCSFNVSRCHQVIGDNYFVQIYNPLAWPVSIPVRIPMQCQPGHNFNVFNPKGSLVKSAVMGIPSPVLRLTSRVNASNCEVVFIAENLPPIGFRSYFIQRVWPSAKTKTKREGSVMNPKIERKTPDMKPKDEQEKVDMKSKTKKETPFMRPKTQEVPFMRPKSDRKIPNIKTKFKRETPDMRPKKKKKAPKKKTKIKSEKSNVTNKIQNIRQKNQSEESERPKRTLIKNINRKSNKKYLIRQTNPQIEDETLLSDLDYDYDETTKAVPEKGNVTMLLESDIDEVRMQQLAEFEDERTSPRPTVEEMRTVPMFPSSKPTDDPIDDDDDDITVKPYKWSKVFTSGRRKMLDDIMKNVIPNRTTTVKYDVTHTAEISSTTTKMVQEDVTSETTKEEDNQTKKGEKTTTEKENLNASTEFLLGHLTTTEKVTTQTEETTDLPSKFKEAVTLPEEIVKRPEDISTTTTDISSAFDAFMTTETEVPEIKESVLFEEMKYKAHEDLKKEMHRKMFKIPDVNNTYIENKYIRITIDPATSKVTGVTLSNGVHVDLDIQFYFYASDDPVALKKTGFKKPGAYLFRAMENTAIPILDYIDMKVYKTPVVEEAHFVYSDWTSFVIRLYDESPVIEVEWLVGPIPVDEGLGKEVFIRYLTNLVHDGVFYTDSNGRQTIKRIRNMRPMYESLNLDQVAGNYYPVTSKISIQDLNSRICFSVFPERAEGGASLSDGELDLMVHRRILTDDTGYQTFVNETEFGKGAPARGKHYLYISKIDYKPYRIFEKKFAKEIQLAPQVLISRPDPYGAKAQETWFKSRNEMSFLKTKLPIGVHVLTIEHWNYDTLLLRLENILEKSDTSRGLIKTVFIRDMFTNIYINSIRETTLAANMWLDEHKPWKWEKKDNFVKNFNDFYGEDKPVQYSKDVNPVNETASLDIGITLAPQQIRTFVCWFDYVEL